MNKSDLAAAAQEGANITKAQSGAAVNAVLEAIQGALVAGDSVTIPGFGTFSVRHTSARTGRNPADGSTIQIAASKVVRFKAGATLKAAVKGS